MFEKDINQSDSKVTMQRKCRSLESQGYRIITVHYNPTYSVHYPNVSCGSSFFDLNTKIRAYK